MYLLINPDNTVNFGAEHPILEGLHTDGLLLVEFENKTLAEVVGDISPEDAYWDAESQTVIIDPSVLNENDIDELKQDYKSRIDLEAGRARRRLASPGDMIDAEYEIALRDAEEWDARGRPSNNVPLSILDWAEVAEIENDAAAQSILDASVNMRGALNAIRKMRLGGKKSVDTAVDIQSVKTRGDATLTVLKDFP